MSRVLPGFVVCLVSLVGFCCLCRFQFLSCPGRRFTFKYGYQFSQTACPKSSRPCRCAFAPAGLHSTRQEQEWLLHFCVLETFWKSLLRLENRLEALKGWVGQARTGELHPCHFGNQQRQLSGRFESISQLGVSTASRNPGALSTPLASAVRSNSLIFLTIHRRKPFFQSSSKATSAG